jgi:hypothetical protein
VSYLPLPHARRVASPPWVLDRRHLRHLCRYGVTAGRATTHARRAVTAPTCAALRRTVAGRTGRGRLGKRRPRAAHTARAPCAHGPS